IVHELGEEIQNDGHVSSGPFTVLKVSLYGHAEIQNDKDGTKFVVNGQRLKRYLSE
ncbi:hypothetical protein PIB30_099455, partial [Stylosanthes scabra]|nr:hypothetical protein [Stylosanthes scabra]